MGKYSLITVVGLGFVLVMLGPNMNQSASVAYENYLEYNARTYAHNAAISGANIAANALFLDPTWNSNYTNMTLGDSKYSTTIEQILNTPRKKITSYGTYKEFTDTVEVILQPSGFSKFAYYSVVEGSITWIGADTIWGPFHTQDKMRTSGAPVFYGKVTNKLGITKASGSKPKFLGGYQTGINLPLPTTLATVKAAAQTGGKYILNKDVTITFKNDSLIYKEGTGTATTVLLSDYAPNGVVIVDGGTLRLKGTIDGRMTVGAMGTSPKGRVYLDDNIQFKYDPRTYPNSKNLLGIVADNEIFITENAANNNDIIIQAAVFSLKKGLGAENYDDRPVSGRIHLLGGIVQYQRQAVGTFSGNTIVTGFGKNYRYDERLLTDSPPFYPTTGLFEIISWRE